MGTLKQAFRRPAWPSFVVLLVHPCCTYVSATIKSPLFCLICLAVGDEERPNCLRGHCVSTFSSRYVIEIPHTFPSK